MAVNHIGYAFKDCMGFLVLSHGNVVIKFCKESAEDDRKWYDETYPEDAPFRVVGFLIDDEVESE
jgi:hypothetical protein